MGVGRKMCCGQAAHTSTPPHKNMKNEIMEINASTDTAVPRSSLKYKNKSILQTGQPYRKYSAASPSYSWLFDDGLLFIIGLLIMLLQEVPPWSERQECRINGL